jgi:holo-[acyl-carrier protein] synthase
MMSAAPPRRMIRGIGIDTIELSRIERVYNTYPGRFIDRVYSEGEKAYVFRFEDPIPRLAARFAAKEACMKALGTGWNGGVRWRDIEVINDKSGRPGLRLLGKARALFEDLSATRIHLTITHSREYATAVVIFE